MLEKIKNKKTLITLGLVLTILLVILTIIIIKINKPNKTKEVIQEIGQVDQGKIICETTERQNIVGEPPPNVDQIDEEEPEKNQKKNRQKHLNII